MASNIQRGTRGLSAGDWVRLQRLRGARNFQSDKNGDITNPVGPHLEVKTSRSVYTEIGTSKIRRPASSYTDYIASQTADYVLESTNSTNLVGKDLTQNWVCSCERPQINVLKGSNGLCRKCSHDPIVNRTS